MGKLEMSTEKIKRKTKEGKERCEGTNI